MFHLSVRGMILRSALALALSTMSFLKSGIMFYATRPVLIILISWTESHRLIKVCADYRSELRGKNSILLFANALNGSSVNGFARLELMLHNKCGIFIT